MANQTNTSGKDFPEDEGEFASNFNDLVFNQFAKKNSEYPTLKAQVLALGALASAIVTQRKYAEIGNPMLTTLLALDPEMTEFEEQLAALVAAGCFRMAITAAKKLQCCQVELIEKFHLPVVTKGLFHSVTLPRS